MQGPDSALQLSQLRLRQHRWQRRPSQTGDPHATWQCVMATGTTARAACASCLHQHRRRYGKSCAVHRRKLCEGDSKMLSVCALTVSGLQLQQPSHRWELRQRARYGCPRESTRARCLHAARHHRHHRHHCGRHDGRLARPGGLAAEAAAAGGGGNGWQAAHQLAAGACLAVVGQLKQHWDCFARLVEAAVAAVAHGKMILRLPAAPAVAHGRMILRLAAAASMAAGG